MWRRPVPRRKRIQTPVGAVGAVLYHVRAAGPSGASTADTARVIRTGTGKTRCVLNALRDVGLVRVLFDSVGRRSIWLACPPVDDEAQALKDAAVAARERIRRRADALRSKSLSELTEYEIRS